MNRGGLGLGEFIEFSKSILHHPAIKSDLDDPFVQIDLCDPPNVAVEDLFLVIVDVLENFIAGRIRPAKALELRGSGRIEPLLERDIQCPGPNNAASGRR